MGSGKWSELPLDALSLILLKLAVPDHLRFASVCTSWASAASELRRRRLQIPQSPWLMFLDPSDPGAAKFYSVTEEKVYSIPQRPEHQIDRRLFFGSAHGWVVTVDKRSEPLLLNPITREQIALPSVTTLPRVEPILHSDGSLTGYTTWGNRYPLDGLRLTLYHSVILSGPPDSGECIAVLLFDSGIPWQVALARPSDEHWTVLDEERVMNVEFHDGLLYSMKHAGVVCAYDLRNPFPMPMPITVRPFPVSFFTYLVAAPWGDLLAVCIDRDYDYGRNAFRTFCVRLFRVDISSRQLVVLQNLVGDYSIFVAVCGLIGKAAVCLSTRDVPGLRANCIYFIDEHRKYSQHHRDHHCAIWIYSLEDGSVEPNLPSDARLYWPPAIWLMPSISE